ncbi:DUF397 domain-containing protein [Streptomyces sp. NWU339]|uniref:DUF397 domain-containing protein n=1 Tax=Streptomyces sp. NWU339 TaxID=2185284 RepID=UPI000D675660|nr:DUF397 domain-containing protein [Streptomyces sp. NWU339]PWI06753.1 DUF397 domain-containing protein [Streptomyces sp. NWU339]
MSHTILATLTIDAAIWRRSSHSGGQGDCLELAHNIPALAPVRDSKDPSGPVILFGRAAWGAFVAHLG